MPASNDAGLPSAIRARRKASGWSLRALSERSGVSAGMLSDIERGAKSPTVRLAYQIAQALGCSITDLLDPSGAAEEAPGPGPAVVGGARALRDPGAGVERTSHPGPLLHGHLEVADYRLEPGASAGPMAPNRPGTIEQVIVIDGSLGLVLDGVVTPVEEGSNAAHGVHTTEYRNASTAAPCRFLVLVDTSRC